MTLPGQGGTLRGAEARSGEGAGLRARPRRRSTTGRRPQGVWVNSQEGAPTQPRVGGTSQTHRGPATRAGPETFQDLCLWTPLPGLRNSRKWNPRPVGDLGLLPTPRAPRLRLRSPSLPPAAKNRIPLAGGSWESRSPSPSGLGTLGKPGQQLSPGGGGGAAPHLPLRVLPPPLLNRRRYNPQNHATGTPFTGGKLRHGDPRPPRL